jgi:mannan endo-1,4-beta-mannosidase
MRSSYVRALAASLIALALLWNPAAASTGPQATVPPPRKLALGVSMLADRSILAVNAFTTSVGKTPAIWSIWSDWRGTNSAFPNTTFLNQLLNRKTVPMIFWQPTDQNNRNSPDFTYKLIVAGKWDTYIRSWATAARTWGHRVIIRFAHEMDDKWFPWGIGNFDNTAANFVAAWRHVWTIFKGVGGVGATNVRFLWSPMNPCACRPQIYPGDAYVDYVGFTSFNWGLPSAWQSMLDGLRARTVSLGKLTHKPVIIAELGSNSKGGNKPYWITNGYPAVYTALPSIKAIVYFNVDMRSAGQPDWRLTTPAGALTAYKGVAAKWQFTGRIP